MQRYTSWPLLGLGEGRLARLDVPDRANRACQMIIPTDAETGSVHGGVSPLRLVT
jgi:hypothetical protein